MLPRTGSGTRSERRLSPAVLLLAFALVLTGFTAKTGSRLYRDYQREEWERIAHELDNDR